MQKLQIFDPNNRDQGREPQRVAVHVADLAPLLADAWNSDRSWLRDFASDEISISTDLYQVLLAYQQYRRSDAA